jgi:DNA-binding NarL/FixJ family response regulator
MLVVVHCAARSTGTFAPEMRSIIGTQRTDSIRVFIADDSQIVQVRLVALLGELAGVEVIGQAGTVPVAIAGIRRLQPDVVLLDIHMPGGSGIDVLQSIKQGPLAPVVIMLTNYPYPAYRERCMRLGADFFFDKSTEFDLVPNVLASLRIGAAMGAA